MFTRTHLYVYGVFWLLNTPCLDEFLVADDDTVCISRKIHSRLHLHSSDIQIQILTRLQPSLIIIDLVCLQRIDAYGLDANVHAAKLVRVAHTPIDNNTGPVIVGSELRYVIPQHGEFVSARLLHIYHQYSTVPGFGEDTANGHIGVDHLYRLNEAWVYEDEEMNE